MLKVRTKDYSTFKKLILKLKLKLLGNNYKLEDLIIVDSGTEVTVVRDTSLLTNVNHNPSDHLLGAGDEELKVEAAGTLCMKFGKKTIRVKVLASKDATCNLISLHALEKAGLIIDLKSRSILNKQETEIGKLINYGKYICLPLNLITHRVQHVSTTKYSMAFLHSLFGHINIKTIKEAISSKLIKTSR